MLDDDFNTPEALALFHDWRTRGRTASLRWGLELFGLGVARGDGLGTGEASSRSRRSAKKPGRTRDFDEADRLRGEIEAQGWEVRDVAGGFELVPK